MASKLLNRRPPANLREIRERLVRQMPRKKIEAVVWRENWEDKNTQYKITKCAVCDKEFHSKLWHGAIIVPLFLLGIAGLITAFVMKFSENGIPGLLLFAFSILFFLGISLRERYMLCPKLKRELADDSPEIYKRIPGEFLNEINRLKAETIGDKSPFGKLLRNTAQAEAEAISVARAWDERCGHEGGEKKAPLYIRDAQTAVQITIKTITEGLNELTSYKQKMEDFFQNCQIEIRRACGPLLDLALLRKTAALTELAQHLPQQVEQAILTSTTEIYSRITTIQQSLEKAYKETTDSVASENANSGNAEQDFSRITEQIKHFLKNKPALPEAPEIAA